MVTLVSSLVCTDLFSATGGSFVFEVTVMLTVATLLSTTPSLATNVKLSEPVKPLLGV